jgi:hypothetical protein
VGSVFGQDKTTTITLVFAALNPKMFCTKAKGQTLNPQIFCTKAKGQTLNPQILSTKGTH